MKAFAIKNGKYLELGCIHQLNQELLLLFFLRVV